MRRRNPDDEYNEYLSYLLLPRGKVPHIGPESVRVVKRARLGGVLNEVALFRTRATNEGSSYRYVYLKAGVPVAAIQVMVPRHGQPKVANVFTDRAERRRGYATELMYAAAEDLDVAVEHSSDLSKAGKSWMESLRRTR